MASLDRSSSINDNERYQKLCAKGMNKMRAARMANSLGAQTSWHTGKYSKYEKWTMDELYQKAAEVGIEGRAHMTKHALIEALREQ